LAEVAQFQ